MMRFLLAVMLVACVTGFVGTSGMVSIHAGGLRLDPAVLGHTVPVLVALAAPMVTMAVILVVTMFVGRSSSRKARNRRVFSA